MLFGIAPLFCVVGRGFLLDGKKEEIDRRGWEDV
jgi:hypothetical protein